jgi:hypothetical protein
MNNYVASIKKNDPNVIDPVNGPDRGDYGPNG